MKRGYLNDAQTFQSVAFSCPQTLLRTNTSLQLATVNLTLGQTLRVRLAQYAVAAVPTRYAGFYPGLSGSPVFLEEREIRRRGAYVWNKPYRGYDIVTATNTDFPGQTKQFICLQSNVYIDPWPSSAVLATTTPFTNDELAEIASLQASVTASQALGCTMTPLDITPPDYNGPNVEAPLCVPPYAVRPFAPQTTLTYWAPFTEAAALFVNSAFSALVLAVFQEGRTTFAPGGRSLFTVQGGLQGAVTSDPRDFHDFTAPGLYSFYLINNTLFADAEVMVTGVARVFDP